MTGTLIDLISDMKICLGLALGTGLVFGYLYTKFKARELFKPDIKNLKRKIQDHEDESTVLHAKNSEVESELERYSNKLHDGHLEVTKHKNEISDLESNMRTLELEGATTKSQYQKQEEIYNNFNGKVEELKTALKVDDISKIEDYKTALKASTIEFENTYQQKSDMYEGMKSEEKALIKENSGLTSKIASIEAQLHKKGYELSDTTQKVATLRDKLQAYFDQLLAGKEENEAKIESFKKQLLAIKEKLS